MEVQSSWTSSMVTIFPPDKHSKVPKWKEVQSLEVTTVAWLIGQEKVTEPTSGEGGYHPTVWIQGGVVMMHFSTTNYCISNLLKFLFTSYDQNVLSHCPISWVTAMIYDFFFVVVIYIHSNWMTSLRNSYGFFWVNLNVFLFVEIKI